MRPPRPLQSIAQRVDEAFAAAEQAHRTPVLLMLGKEDHPDFQAWLRETDADGGGADLYRGVPVRLNELVFLSCLELQASPGLPNALRL